MIIANPIYDVVFKYLLEDLDIARELLAGKSRTKLEKVLQVFSPEFKTEDRQRLDFNGDLNEPLVQKIVARLGRAIASEEVRERMDVEDEIDRMFERELAKVALEKDNIIAAKDQELVAERQRAEAESQRAEALLKELEELRKQLKK